ncbi:hypothetical protein AAE478_000995 [Parahypoxylon ruwenzoriense]
MDIEKLGNMSCEWRRTSNDQWELSQSNPPSDLTQNPVTPASSNPDERSSSPVMQGERIQGSRRGRAHESQSRSAGLGNLEIDGLFSNAARAEREPIPRHDQISDPEEMSIVDTPPQLSHRQKGKQPARPVTSTDRPNSTPSQPSNIDNHALTVGVDGEGEEIMKPPISDSGDDLHMEEDGATNLGSDAVDFEMPESEMEDTDSSYAEETTRRRGKLKPQSKKASGKAKQRAVPKSATQKASMTTKKSRQTTIAKSQSQQVKAPQKTAPKRIKKVSNPAGAEAPTANAPTGSSMVSTRILRNGRKHNVGRGPESPGTVIPDSRVSFVQGQEKAKPLAVRLPKKSFYEEPENAPSTHIAQDAYKNGKCESSAHSNVEDKQSSGSRDHACSNTIIIRDSDDICDDPSVDVYEKQESTLPPGDQVGNQAHLGIPEAVVGPNSKKKRSPMQSGPQSEKAIQTMTQTIGNRRNTSQEVLSNKHEQKNGFEDQASRYGKEPVIPTSGRLDNETAGSFHYDENPAMNTVVSIRAEERIDRSSEQISSHTESIKQPTSDVELVASDQDLRPSEKTPELLHKHMFPGNLETSVQFSDEPSPSSSSVVEITKHKTKQTTPQPLVVRKSTNGLEEPRKNHNQQAGVTRSYTEQNPVKDWPDDLQPHAFKDAPKQVGSLKQAKGKERVSSAEQVHSLLPTQCKLSSQREAPENSPSKSSNGVYICVDQQNNVYIPDEERQYISKKAQYRMRRVTTPPQKTRRSMVSESGSPLRRRRKGTAANIATASERNPLYEIQRPASREERFKLQAKPQALFSHNLSWPPQMSSESGSRFSQEGDPFYISRVHTQARGIERTKILEEPEHYQRAPNTLSRVALSPSLNKGRLVKNPKDVASQLNPKSVDFARRIFQGQKQTGYYRDSERGKFDERRDCKQVMQPWWPEQKVPTKPRNEPEPVLSKAVRSVDFLGGQTARECDSRPKKVALKHSYETRWQDAVDAACGGMVDTLHLISTSLLEHLRTREEKVFAIVHEYKRNGTRITDKLAECQAKELLNASTTMKHKCLELATVYRELSGKTQAFRTEYLSKHRNEGYKEWQRQVAGIRGAIHKAREGMEAD